MASGSGLGANLATRHKRGGRRCPTLCEVGGEENNQPYCGRDAGPSTRVFASFPDGAAAVFKVNERMFYPASEDRDRAARYAREAAIKARESAASATAALLAATSANGGGAAGGDDAVVVAAAAAGAGAGAVSAVLVVVVVIVAG